MVEGCVSEFCLGIDGIKSQDLMAFLGCGLNLIEQGALSDAWCTAENDCTAQAGSAALEQ